MVREGWGERRSRGQAVVCRGGGAMRVGKWGRREKRRKRKGKKKGKGKLGFGRGFASWSSNYVKL